MNKTRFRALVLCAGYGTRLRPLTWTLPKALLPVAGEAVAGHTLNRLRAAGCEAAVINLHHLPEEVPRDFGRQYHGLPLEYSFEEEIQGTYGALFARRELLADSDAVVIINGDSWCRWPVKKVLEHHRRRRADATLLVLDQAPDQALGGGIATSSEGRILQMREMEKISGHIARRHIFAGFHVISPRLLERIENRPGDILEDLYQPLLLEGARLESFSLPNRFAWHDLGTPGRYHAASLDVLKGRGLARLFGRRRSFISSLASIEESVEIESSHIERGVRIERGACVQSSVVLEGAHIGAGCRIKSSIVGSGVHIAPASEVEQRMMTRHDKRHELRPSESQMGDLVYTPL